MYNTSGLAIYTGTIKTKYYPNTQKNIRKKHDSLKFGSIIITYREYNKYKITL